MNKSIVLWVIMALLIASSVEARIQYPFGEGDTTDDMLAYWYNVPEDSVSIRMMGGTFRFYSSLHIYGAAPGDSFTARAEAYAHDGQRIFDRVFEIVRDRANEQFETEFNGGFFKLSCPVPYVERSPERIVIVIDAAGKKRTREIECRYHTLSGTITDFEGDPFRAFVVIRPDEFSFSIGVWSDASGRYEIELPERAYNNIAVDDESYGIETAEAWGWHIIMDSDQVLDFKVGTGEVYNLQAWANNGGGNTYFVSFRPMSIHLFKNLGAASPIDVNGSTFDLIDIAPDLKAADITVRINGKEAGIVSMQKYFETAGNTAMPAYLLQVSRDGHATTGKQTILVEYESNIEVDGEMLKNSSMGCVQLFMNYSGLSRYY